MATSPIDKYERILQADPRSRIFVELARALLQEGDAARAAEVCERGLAHHPGSVQARITWGKALLALQREDEAVKCFEEAFDADPSSAYAAELAAEALAGAGMGARALPLLEKAAAAHPGDARIRKWIAGAGGAANGTVAETRTVAAESSPAPTSLASPPEASEATASEPGASTEADTDAEAEAPATAQALAPVEPSPSDVSELTASPAWDGSSPTRAAEAEDRSAAAGDPPAAAPAEVAPAGASEPEGTPASAPLDLLPRLTPPPLRPQPPPRAGRERTDPERVLTLIPKAAEAPGSGPPEAVRPAEAAAPHDEEEAAAAEAARKYEHKLREQLLAQPAPPPSFLQRNKKAVALAVAALVVIAGAVTFAVVRAQRRLGEAREAVTAARKGIARDTLGSLREATRVLERARRADPANAEADVLAAEAAALLAHDFGDAAAGATAGDLLRSGRAGAAGPAVRWLLADGGHDEAERQSAAAALLAAAGDAPPFAHALAGEILLARSDREGARRQLEAAARATPPLLRALCALGDADLASGDAEAALARYQLVLRAHATHPGAAIGAAEARLQLGRELPEALRTLQAVEADPTSAPRARDRLRMDLAMARLLAATGHAPQALNRLQTAASQRPDRPEIAAAQAEVLSRIGAFDRALRAARGAVKLAPGEASYRELVARLQLDSERYADLLTETASAPTRTIRLYRGIALFRLGNASGARHEFEAMRRDGKMPADAAAWMALAELALGHRREAEAITQALLSAPTPGALAFVARARLDLASSRADLAERRFREALARDPDVPEARVDLGSLLLARGRAAEASDVLEKAVATNPGDFAARLALGRARAATGDAAGAARELQAALEIRPRDSAALVELATARLALGDPAASRQAAEQAIAANPRLARAWVAAGKAAAAQGDHSAARHMFDRAAKLGRRAR
jgi:tetratricopeptide (TPR) repeat protein